MRQKKYMIIAEGQVSELKDQMKNSARRQQESKIRLKYKNRKKWVEYKGVFFWYIEKPEVEGKE